MQLIPKIHAKQHKERIKMIYLGAIKKMHK